MPISSESLLLIREAIGYSLLATIFSFLWAPLLTKILYSCKITRTNPYDPTLAMEGRREKIGVLPIGVMLLSALLGGIDDVLNIYGERRRNRDLKHTLRLIHVHKNWGSKVWLILTLPWAIFKRTSLWLGSHPGKGIHVHEKLLLQFAAGAITAWWIYYKLGDSWHNISIPFDGFINVGWWLIPLIIFFVMITANAVNFADGMDGLAGGSLIITFAALTLLSWLAGIAEITILNATVVGALIAYTYFNIKPARFQMGDVGSLGLGALLAINTIVINKMVLLPLFGFIFYIEIFSVLIQIFFWRF